LPFLRNAAQTLDFYASCCLLKIFQRYFMTLGAKAMFTDLFDFGKKRTLKQSVGFFIFHSGLVLAVMAVMSALGAA
jgi:hypothetical protein